MTEERKEQIANNILWFVIGIIAGVFDACFCNSA